MSELGFFTPIVYDFPDKSFHQKVFEAVDGYFYLGNDYAFIDSKSCDHDQIVVTISPYGQNTTKKTVIVALKILSYMTVVIPVLMLAAKLVFRMSHTFIVFSEVEITDYSEKGIYFSHLKNYIQESQSKIWTPKGLKFIKGELLEIKKFLQNTEIDKIVDRCLRKIEDRIANETVKGFTNGGRNICFVNSCLQPLLAVENFKSLIPDEPLPEPPNTFEERRNILNKFKDFFRAWENNKSSKELGDLVSSLRQEVFNARLEEGGFILGEVEQTQCAVQFFDLLLYVIGMGFKVEHIKVPKVNEIPLDNRVVTADARVVDFLKSEASSIQERVNENKNPIERTLSDDNLWKLELEGENEPICISKFDEQQKIVGEPPKILVIYTGGVTKIQTHKTPRKYKVDSQRDQTVDFAPLFKTPFEKIEYKLVGFGHNDSHVHWISVVQKDGEWYYCSDDIIKPIVPDGEEFKKGADFLVYQLI